MPELPEVEAVCRKLRAEALGARIVAVKVMRPAVAKPQAPELIEQSVRGRTLRSVDRRGKNILLRLSGGTVLRVHLRMTGNLYVVPDIRFLPSTVRFSMELPGQRGIVFDDPRALGRISCHGPGEIEQVLEDIGPEPLSPAFTSQRFIEDARQSRLPSKLYLMDQRKVAGLGNIYAAEALFQARISPLKAMNRISPARLRGLHAAIIEVLTAAVESAVRTYSTPGEFSEAEEFPVAVYGREGEGCFACGKPVRRIAQGGRSTYFCPRCQRR